MLPPGQAGCTGCQGLGVELEGKPSECLSSSLFHLCFLRRVMGLPWIKTPLLLSPRTHFQDVSEQGWVLLDLGAEDSGELYLLLFCKGSWNCPTKPEKFLEGN